MKLIGADSNEAFNGTESNEVLIMEQILMKLLMERI